MSFQHRVSQASPISAVAAILVCTLADFTPEIENRDWHARKASVEKLTDQSLLAKLAIEDKDWQVRLAAIEKLTA